MKHAQNDSLFEHLRDFRPSLAAHIRLLPQTYRGERWYVLADEANNQFMRFNARSYTAIGRFDGSTTLSDLFSLVKTGDHAFTQAELASLVLQLSSINALKEALPDDVKALARNASGTSRAMINPLALRFKLFDPDRLLDIFMPWVRSFFTQGAALVWGFSILLAVVIAIVNAHEISLALHDNLLSPRNLVIGWVVFTVMKVIHEFAHAFAVKRWGGEVHEMGISLLVLLPVPYVDASASWAFRSKYRRALVGAIGVMAELWMAALALFVFVTVEPGLVRDMALNTMLIGTLSSLLVNGNPLLRFDGYYVLQDLIEIPNLSSRSAVYVRQLVQRKILGLSEVTSSVASVGERRWLAVYGIAAGIYRFFILGVIALFLASKYLVVGVAIISWAVLMQIVMPMIRSIKFMLFDERLKGRRLTSNARAILVFSAVISVLAFVPVRNNTVTQGIVWLPQQAQLYTQTSGVLSELVVSNGQRVEVGDVIAVLRNPDLNLQREVLKAQGEVLATRLNSVQFADRPAANALREERAALEAEIKALDDELAALEVLSPHSGTVVFGSHQTLIGQYVAKGDHLAYIVDPDDYIVRTVVSQNDIGILRTSLIGVEVRLADRLDQTLKAKIVQETPEGHSRLPSRALSLEGGGAIQTDPLDSAGVRTLTEVFDINLELPAGTPVSGIGGRAFVRFQHAPAPLLEQWRQRLRQLLLRRLSV